MSFQISKTHFKYNPSTFQYTPMLNLKDHIRGCPLTKHFGCILCEYRSSRKSNLTKHFMTHTKEKPFKCYDCNFCAATKSTLILHIRTHTGEKPYQCATCERSFSRKNILKAHVRTHTNVKPFKCSECIFVTSRKDNLNFHKRRHLLEKPFKCHICTSSFIQKCRLKKHIELHVKIFQCSSCCYRTHLETNLVKHKASHYKTNFFVCFACGKGFNKKYALRIHILRQHRNNKCSVQNVNRFTNLQLVKNGTNIDERSQLLLNAVKTFSDKAIATDDLCDTFPPLSDIKKPAVNLIDFQARLQSESQMNPTSAFNNFNAACHLNEEPDNFSEMPEPELSSPILIQTANSSLEPVTNSTNFEECFNLDDFHIPTPDDSTHGSSSSDSEYLESDSISATSSSYGGNIILQDPVQQNCFQNVAFLNNDIVVNAPNLNYVLGVNFMQPLIIPTVSLQPSLTANSVVLTAGFNNVQVNPDISYVPVCNNTNLFLNNLVPNVLDTNIMLNPTKHLYVTDFLV